MNKCMPDSNKKNPVQGKQRARAEVPLIGFQEDGPNAVPLVEQEGLYLRVVPPARRPDMPPSVADEIRAQLQESAQVFRAAFVGVWEGIPGGDQRILLDYWRSRRDYAPLVDQRLPSYPRPAITLLSNSPGSAASPVCSQWGHQLTIPAALTEGSRQHLEWAIATALAQVYRYATRAYYGLVLSMLEEPLEAWENGKGARATEAVHARKVHALERDYLRAHETQMALVLRRWGFTEPGVPDATELAPVPADAVSRPGGRSALSPPTRHPPGQGRRLRQRP